MELAHHKIPLLLEFVVLAALVMTTASEFTVSMVQVKVTPTNLNA